MVYEYKKMVLFGCSKAVCTRPPHVQARWGKPLGGEGSQKPAKEPETHPAHTAWSSTRRPSYTTVTQVSPMQAQETFKAKNFAV